MARKYFSAISNFGKSFKNHLLSLPSIFRAQVVNTKDNFIKLQYKLHNLAESNIDLGIYHLRCHHYNDAIFRFKMVDKFFDPDNKEANYWLSWTYFMKKDYKKAIISLNKSQDLDKVGLLDFIKSIDNKDYVPPLIYSMHRDIIAEIIADKYISKEDNLLIDLVSELNKQARNLPENYNILELGSNMGILGTEINRRMQECYKLTGVEISDKMIELQNLCFPGQKLYDETINSPVEVFLQKEQKKYDVIYSLEGFSTNKILKQVFNNIFSLLKNSGYFAFIIRTDNQTILRKEFLEFAYNTQYVKEELENSGFKILSSKNFILEIKNNYSIFVCKK
jgi:predicted TPR repeat methyltransferase